MMGRQDEPERLFYEFRLESHVPRDHLLRGIDAVTDFSEIRKSLEPYYSSTGRPSIDPELMIRMLLIGYCFGIRSERRLCEEVHLNLAYRWFCRLGLEGAVPDHSTFSKTRHGRFRESELFRRVFEEVVRACMKTGLVGGEGFAIDASVIEADATRAYFVFDATANAFTCSAGKTLLNNGLVRDDGAMPYRASTRDCWGWCVEGALHEGGVAHRDAQSL
jgi:transposase